MFVVDGDYFGAEFDADGGVVVEFELFLEELEEDAGFAHGGVADDDVFEEEGVATHYW